MKRRVSLHRLIRELSEALDKIERLKKYRNKYFTTKRNLEALEAKLDVADLKSKRNKLLYEIEGLEIQTRSLHADHQKTAKRFSDMVCRYRTAFKEYQRWMPYMREKIKIAKLDKKTNKIVIFDPNERSNSGAVG